MLLEGENPTDVAWIESKSLDGETNLKMKIPVRSKVDKSDVRICAETPNPNLYKFDAKITGSDERLLEALSINNLLLRGSSLKNVDQVLGFVL